MPDLWSDISFKDLVPSIKEVVDNGGEATFTPRGFSMRPMLFGGRDEIVLVKPQLPLKKYDLPFYIRKNGVIVLHRIVGVSEKQGKTVYIMRGDNTYENEYGITDDMIIGVVSRFKRKGKWHDVTSRGYRAYAKIWSDTYLIRKPLRFVLRLPVRAFRKIKSLNVKP